MTRAQGNILNPARSSGGSEPAGEDRKAFEAMARQQEGVLRGIAMRLCRDPEEARDIVQDTFERAFKAFPRKPPGASPRSWLATILRNRFIDSWRRASLARNMEAALEKMAEPPAEEPAAEWASITTEQLLEAVDTLDEEFRAVYLMHAIEGRSYQQIAAALGIPRPTVGTRLLRARRKLREVLFAQVSEGAP